MAYNPQHEDYQRLWLRYARTLEQSGATDVAREFASFGRRFAQDRDSLPQTDADRSFHLVSEAAMLVDYKAPFADEPTYRKLRHRAQQYLDEALSLDPDDFDARRMSEALRLRSFEAYYRYLRDNADQAKASYQKALDEATQLSAQEDNPDRAHLSRDLALRPYLRWLASWSEQALICGRNREALRIAHQAFQLDPTDAADIRFTATYAAAKLEDVQELEDLAAHTFVPGCQRAADDPWTLLARAAMGFKTDDPQMASSALEQLLHLQPNAAEVLIRQSEFSDGYFSRLCVAPYSEDEVILAVSEGSVLFQEGRDDQGRGALSDWLAVASAHRDPSAAMAVMRERMQGRGDSGTPGTPGSGQGDAGLPGQGGARPGEGGMPR